MVDWLKREGKVLYEKNNGYYDYCDESKIAGDSDYEREEITEWAKDEDGIARKCGTGNYVYKLKRE